MILFNNEFIKKIRLSVKASNTKSAINLLGLLLYRTVLRNRLVSASTMTAVLLGKREGDIPGLGFLEREVSGLLIGVDDSPTISACFIDCN
jgi:hypothetical protein